ncbi:MAG: radical SAM protein [Pseudomonadota bacterium]
MALLVSEIFFSIQGESTHAGLPCVFVRLAGCNLRCSYCDTGHALEDGTRMSVEEVASRTIAYRVPLVEITGGEPLLQEDVYSLMDTLLDAGSHVLLETNGSLPLGRVDSRIKRIVDVKCPGSGAVHSVNWANMPLLGPRDEVKFVLSDRTDYDFARGAILHHSLLARGCAVLLSPVRQRLEPKDLAGWMLEDKLRGVRLQLQLHRIIWGEERGR